ncbi:SCP2 sterol-binding domain-containing protein [Hyphococcus sp.]|jgi:hypothetical protein|uniref:SCP2 sterol-binding domain-containing protein n=1 Tax=Hyphococcus sp. TaxID=2038636 RepID=UPI003D0DF495
MADAGDTDALMIAAKKAFAAPFGAVLKIAPDNGCPLWVDGRQNPPQISSDAPGGLEADCLWRGAREALVRAMSGARAFESAYVSGRVAVSGDISVMARLTLDESR